QQEEPDEPEAVPSQRAPALVTCAALGVAAVWSAAVVVAAQKPGRYDVHLFEAAYLVPQEHRPPRPDRVVIPGQDVWTELLAFPGYLPSGRSVATALDVSTSGSSNARLTVLLDGSVILDGKVTTVASTTIEGQPFDA